MNDDLAQLETLDEGTLIGALRTRYKQQSIYTYVGDILVAVNPYTDIGIYGADSIRSYTKAAPSSMPPHVFAVADTTFSSLVRTSRSQVCVVSGESGAGKTETTKHLIQHILSRCSGSQTNLHQKINQMSPVLEAFGNAQTVMNNNSSRFGKFMEITFDKHGGVTGGLVTEYLLERSRVVEHAGGERSFHVFYYCVAGMTEAQRTALSVPVNARFRSLGDERHNNDSQQWRQVLSALTTVGVVEGDIDEVLTLLAATLHCGELKFSSTDEEGSTVANAPRGQLVGRLLGVSEADLVLALTTKVTAFRNEKIVKALTTRQATDCSRAIAKAVYGRLFSWIVSRINAVLATGQAADNATSIGLLDIFGFENFAVNSFEQVCINLANEKLQFYFNEHIFRQELDEYKAEGLGGIALTYSDNTAVLELLTKRPLSVMTILDEESRMQSASDSSFSQKIAQHLEPKAGSVLKCGNAEFSVTHYAGMVKYRVTNFVVKNRDDLPVLVGTLLSASQNRLLAALFQGSAAGTQPSRQTVAPSRRGRSVRKASARPARGNKKTPTVGSQFVTSLDLLVAKMTQANPHFVRCIKPNREAAANSWNDALVLEQLKYTGMLETIRIRREGFALRLKFADFVERYGGIGYDFTSKPPSTASSVETILRKTNISGYLVGKTKVFLKYFHAAALLQQLEAMATAAVKVQTWLRKALCMQNLKRLLAVSRAEAESAKLFLLDLAAGSSKLSHLINVTEAEDVRRMADKQVPGESNLDMSTLTPKPVFQEGPVKRPEPGTKAHIKHTAKLEKESIKWFRATQRENVSKSGAPLRGSAARKKRAKDRRSISPWFHGLISRERAERELFRSANGTFLIRIAQERLGYCVSVHWGGVFRHFRVYEAVNGHFSLEEASSAKRFETLPELVAFYRDHDISAMNHERLISALSEVPMESQRAPSATVEGEAGPEVDYVQLVWDEKLAMRRVKHGKTDDIGIPSRPEAVAAFVADQISQDKRNAIKNSTVLSIENRFGHQQTAANHIYLPHKARGSVGTPKVLLRTHTAILRQQAMIADAERRILEARTEWRRQKKQDELGAKQKKKGRKRGTTGGAGARASGPTMVELEGYPALPTDIKSQDYRSLKGVRQEVKDLSSPKKSKQKKKEKEKKKKKTKVAAVAAHASGPSLVSLEGGYPALPTGDVKSHDYRSLKGMLHEMQMLPP